MIELNLVQGSPEWLAHREKYRNASDTPSVIGSSAYKSRAALLKERATGITPEVDAATQRRFDDGHKFEALARPLMEKIVGEDLFPVVGVDGLYSASFDGLTMMGDTNAEHKTLNDAIRACSTVADLPLMYREQMEHQMMVSGAGRSLFFASKWKIGDDGEYVLEEEKHFWYEPDMALRQKICAAWDQFEIDVASYVPCESKEMPKAEVTIDLPTLFVHAKGEITTHNMNEFGKALAVKLADTRAIVLVTDQDFSNAKDAAKKFRETAKAIALSKDQMLAQTETIGEAVRKMDAWAIDLNATALQLEKDVKREDLAKKEVMVLSGKNKYAEHIAALESEIKPIRLIVAAPNFAEAIKGKSKYTSMQDAVNTMLAGAKMEADSAAKDVRGKLVWLKENAAGRSALFPDLQQIIFKPMEDLAIIITSRIDNAKTDEAERLEAERATIRAEEQAKAQREADAKAAEEREAKAKEAARIAPEAATAQRVIDDAAAEAKRAADAVAAQQLHELAQQQAEQRKEETDAPATVACIVDAPSHDDAVRHDINKFVSQMTGFELIRARAALERILTERQEAA